MNINNIDRYINFKFVELTELKGKVIKDVFTNQYDNYSFIVTEDNELSGYILKYFPDSIDEESSVAQIYPMEFNDVIEFIIQSPNDYFFEVNNLLKDKDELYKEIDKMYKQQEVEQQEFHKKQRYNQYLELKKEFEGK